ncbi:hypothetical protein Btru_034136 [Bulinus truncatus]|nr:hypothetical protein Btru_034136 [Bulinus truncatus]
MAQRDNDAIARKERRHKSQHADDILNKTNIRLQQGVFQCVSRGSNRGMFCDFTVVVEGLEFPCHKFVLNACSGFFEALLRSDMKERQENKVTIHGISKEIFKMILDAVYIGSDILTQQNMVDTWNAAHQLQIDFLMSECEDFVTKNINSVNCCSIYFNAVLLQSAKVCDFVLSYMVKHFFSFAVSANFSVLEYEVFLQMLQNKELPVCVDFQVEAILKWCGIENGDRKQHQLCQDKSHNMVYLGYLLQAVDLSQVSKQCLANLLRNPAIQENKQAVSLVNTQAATCLSNSQSEDNDLYGEDRYKHSVKKVKHYDEVEYQYRENKMRSDCKHCQKMKNSSWN